MTDKSKLSEADRLRGAALVLVELAFEEAWCRETASPACQANWEDHEPSWGQCAVTALVVQDRFGGELIRTVVGPFGSHYYNRLADGGEVDLTRGQFPPGTVVPPGQPADRAAVLQSERAIQARTTARYELLKQRFEQTLARFGQVINARLKQL